MKEHIITHRGLEPSSPTYQKESSYEAFKSHIDRGYNIEFDPNFTSDGIVVWHDHTLKRLSSKSDTRSLHEISTSEAVNTYKLTKLDDILHLIQNSKTTHHALHLKGTFHDKANLDRLIETLESFPDALPKLFLFDLPPMVAQTIKDKCPTLRLAPSVAHPYDIQRYNKAANNTLITINTAIEHKELYKWIWLDEWDLSNQNGSTKTLYNEATFTKARNAGFKVALASPELHASSPSLLGNESHPDAEQKRLQDRMKKLICLQPDAICTDYPEELLGLYLKEANCV